MRHTTPHGLTITSKSEHNKGVNGALEAKFFHAKSGVSIDKAKVCCMYVCMCVRECVCAFVLQCFAWEFFPLLV